MEPLREYVGMGSGKEERKKKGMWRFREIPRGRGCPDQLLPQSKTPQMIVCEQSFLNRHTPFM